MRFLVSLLLFVFVQCGESFAETTWLPVSSTSGRSGIFTFGRVTVHGEQATLHTVSLGRRCWYGYGFVNNLHTRNLSFTFRGATYAVPERFAGDLLRLHLVRGGATSPYALKADAKGKEITFTLRGADGEKGYTADFEFRDGRFTRRILHYGEEQRVYIHTAER